MIGTWYRGGAPARNQNLPNWIANFEQYVPKIKETEEVCFIGHSIGPLFSLHVLEKFDLVIQGAVYVAPFLKLPIPGAAWQIDRVNESFYKTDFNFDNLKRRMSQTYGIYSDNDPYVAPDMALEFINKLNSSPILAKNSHHFGEGANLKQFPLVFELCKAIAGKTLSI